VDALDGFAEFIEPRTRISLLVPQHESFVNTGEGLVLRIFKQARRAHSERVADLFQKCLEITLQSNGKRRVEKALLNFRIVVAVQCEVLQIIFGEEFVEDVRGQNHSRRYRNANAGKAA